MKERKKILHITGAMNIGGTETMLVNLYRKVNKDIEFHFISYSKEEAYYDKEIESLGGKIIRLQPPGEAGFIKAIGDIKQVIKENGPYDAVHSHMMFNCGIGMIAAYLSGIKVRVSHAHTTAENSVGFVRKAYISTMSTMIKTFSTDFLACSNGAAEYLFGKGITKNKNYRMLPNYIDYDTFIKCNDNNNIRKELGIEADDIVVCHIGRFIDAKNHKFLVDVASEMINENSKVKLILTGDGDLRKEIEDKVRSLNIEKNVYFLGLRKDIPNILNNSDLFILPSTYEGLGLVLLEAQASKVPCLVSEAIQPEVDLGIGLVNKLNLADGIEAWKDKSNKILNRNSELNIDIDKAVKVKGYDLNNIMKTLLSVYKIDL